MSNLIEDRLRAHFADRAARDVLPGPEVDAAVDRARQDSDPSGDRVSTGKVTWLPRRRALVAAAAAAALVAVIAAGALVARNDDPARVATDPEPAPTVPDREPDADPTPSTTPSTGPSTTPSTSATTVPPPAGEQPTGPIVSVEGVLGTWSGSEWVQWEAGATPPLGDEYQVVRLGDSVTTAVSASGTDCSPSGQPSVDLGLVYPDNRLDPRQIAVSGVGDVRPRPVEVLDPATPEYRDAAAAVVADLDIADPAPQVGQVVRGDLDGDGSAEVVVVAERLADPAGGTAAEGDYSVVFVRRAVGGAVETTVIAMAIAQTQPGTFPIVEAYRVGAFADLNGDGRMEIVVNAHYWESSSTFVHELRADGSLPEVLRAFCGV